MKLNFQWWKKVQILSREYWSSLFEIWTVAVTSHNLCQNFRQCYNFTGTTDEERMHWLDFGCTGEREASCGRFCRERTRDNTASCPTQSSLHQSQCGFCCGHSCAPVLPMPVSCKQLNPQLCSDGFVVWSSTPQLGVQKHDILVKVFPRLKQLCSHQNSRPTKIEHCRAKEKQRMSDRKRDRKTRKIFLRLDWTFRCTSEKVDWSFRESWSAKHFWCSGQIVKTDVTFMLSGRWCDCCTRNVLLKQPHKFNPRVTRTPQKLYRTYRMRASATFSQNFVGNVHFLPICVLVTLRRIVCFWSFRCMCRESLKAELSLAWTLLISKY